MEAMVMDVYGTETGRIIVTMIGGRNSQQKQNGSKGANGSFFRNFFMEKDMQLRELYEKLAKMEHDLHGGKGMRAKLMQVHADVKELTATP
nr:protein FLX-like 1 [Tanacetum cinerariifolium]